MGDKILFPMNFDRYLKMGSDALKEGRLTEAIDYFEEAYSLKQDFQVNELIVQCLLEQGEFARAKVIAQEMKNDYFQKQDSAKRYVAILLGNREFQLARETVKRLDFPEPTVKELVQDIETAEEFVSIYLKNEIKEIKEDLEKIANQNFFGQSRCIKRMESLPKEDYIASAKTLIDNGHIRLLLRNSLLDQLVMHQVNEEINISDIQEEVHHVSVSTLTRIDKQKTYKEAQILLDERLQDVGDELQDNLKREQSLYFSLLYPFADEQIQTPALWVNLFLQRYLGEVSNVNHESQEAQRYQNLQKMIHKEMMKMTEDI